MDEKSKRTDDKQPISSYKDQINESAGPKPRIWGIVGLGLIRGAIGTLLSINNINDLNTLQAQGYEFEGWVVPVLYAGLGLAIFAFIAAVLIAMYKRWGLYFGIIAFGGDLLVGAVLLLTIGVTGGWLALALDAVIVYYIYRYLTRQPETTYFT